ncbi:hypothetical protein B0H34DRAFT_688286 [Crassisporium funariophilum]|nr:hypothetical protein B0H34DRAFT_688286 [Crassisporium funariophilum]
MLLRLLLPLCSFLRMRSLGMYLGPVTVDTTVGPSSCVLQLFVANNLDCSVALGQNWLVSVDDIDVNSLGCKA